MRAVQIGSYYLAGDPAKTAREHSPCDGFYIAGMRSQQRQSGMRWASNRYKDLGNASLTISFNTRRVFESAIAAMLWCADYPQVHPWQGTVRLTDHDGTQYDLPNALIARPARVPVGVEVPLAYMITATSILEVEA